MGFCDTIPLPSREDMNFLTIGDTPAAEVPEGTYAVRFHPDGTYTFLTKEEYDELWQQK